MSAVQVSSHAMVTLSVAELEGLIRRLVREEMLHAFEAWDFYEEPTVIEPGSPLDEDLSELIRMKEEGSLHLLTHAEVWGADEGSG
ncbi:MAG TPA: hypothetical protein VMY80_03065 [Anaerolineae bacterium]|nr:hypothetical protein [Anaerolineae bacterium]